MHGLRRALALTVILGLAGMASTTVSAASGSAAATQARSQAGGGQVTVREIDEKYHFIPASITVQVGASVTWTNKTDAPHTVTSDTGAFNTNQFQENQMVTLTFSNPGTFPYHCSIHPYMHGTIIVQAATSTGGAVPPPAFMPSPGGGGTARTVVGLPRTGGGDATSRDDTLSWIVLMTLLGLSMIMSGIGLWCHASTANETSAEK